MNYKVLLIFVVFYQTSSSLRLTINSDLRELISGLVQALELSDQCDLIMFDTDIALRTNLTIIYLTYSYCAKKTGNCNLQARFPKTTCFVVVVGVKHISRQVPILKTLFRPGTVNRGKFIFHPLDLEQRTQGGNPWYITNGRLENFKYKMEITLTRNCLNESRLLAFEYQSIPVKSTKLIASFSLSQGIHFYGYRIFNPSIWNSKTKNYSMNFVFTSAYKETNSSSPQSIQFPEARLALEILNIFNWTMGNIYYESLLSKYLYVHKLNTLRNAIGFAFIPSVLNEVEISNSYQSAFMGIMLKTKPAYQQWETIYLLLSQIYEIWFGILLVNISLIFTLSKRLEINIFERKSFKRLKELKATNYFSLKLWEKFRRCFKTIFRMMQDLENSLHLMHQIALLQHKASQILYTKFLGTKLCLGIFWAVCIWSSFHVRTELTSLASTKTRSFLNPENYILEIIQHENPKTVFGGTFLNKRLVQGLYGQYEKWNTITKIVDHLEQIQNPKTCVEKLLSNANAKYSCVYFSEILDLTFYSFPRWKREQLIIKPFPIFSVKYNLHIAYPKDFPFSEIITKKLSSIVETGIYQHWRNEFLWSHVPKALSSKQEKIELVDDSVKSNYLLSFFQAFVALYLFATTVFIAEVCLSKCILLLQKLVLKFYKYKF